eukprot:11323915-Alexandrium_andersonii.AAC.1
MCIRDRCCSLHGSMYRAARNHHEQTTNMLISPLQAVSGAVRQCWEAPKSGGQRRTAAETASGGLPEA